MDLKTRVFRSFWVQGLSGAEKKIVHITKSAYFDWHYLSEVSKKPVCHIYPEHT